jgi:hypothetical protein
MAQRATGKIEPGSDNQGIIMRNLIVGFVLGIVVATVGFSGVARMLDNGIGAVKTHSKELAQ